MSPTRFLCATEQFESEKPLTFIKLLLFDPSLIIRKEDDDHVFMMIFSLLLLLRINRS